MPYPPIRLADDNFTPASRTPWGGHRIVQHYKRALLAQGVPPDAVVGEAWELSATPEFPSRTADGDLLRDRIAAAPDQWLGRERDRGGTALLVKWLDAADNLSVQIHPSDDYPALAPDEAGKPECWYVIERAPGAGLYVGLQPGVDRGAMEAALASDADVSTLLRFVPVEPGDFFVLEPGMPHAIGAGVMLLEPQFVQPGRKGVTYRYWDWGRRYDAAGRLSASGSPRSLHVEDALAVTDWVGAGDPNHCLARQHRLAPPALRRAPRFEPLCGPPGEAPISSPFLQVGRLSGTGAAQLPNWDALRSVTVIEGTLTLADLRLPAGQTAAVPAAADGLSVVLDAAHAIVSAAL